MTIREFRMPDVGEGLTEAEILKWYVRPGDTVSDGQIVCEVETAKAVVELPIPFDGVVHELRFDEGVSVDVGRVIITVTVAGGEVGAAAAPVHGPVDAQGVGGPVAEGRHPVLVGYGVSPGATERRPRKTRFGGTVAPAPAGTPHARNATPGGDGDVLAAGPKRPLAKPPVRRLAKDLGVNLSTVTPTGEGGTVTREDVHAAAAAATGTAAPQAGSRADIVAAGARETRIPVKGVRKITARAMVGSAFTAPHVTEFITLDVTRTMKLAEELKADRDMASLHVSPLLLIAKAVLTAVRRNPEVNASWDEAAQEIVLKHYVNLGIAAATPRGLIVPNIKDAHTKSLAELAQALTSLVTAAREGRTLPSDMRGGTLTITNVGVFGVDTGTPILNPGESAILAVGAIRLQPWVHKGKVKPRRVMTLALSFDHRLIDGELGSMFLADIAAILEQPERLITWS
ncbi:dihydrolipoamide acetyltransferase family protein [Streptomyces lavendofoliae]|uniref:dihydrolipoamide acetyltransferase family protein n=1 Tax=Streptomyces lavendofoliae TaxID=67314 RepID=UPI00300F433F